MSKRAKWQTHDLGLGIGETSYLGESSEYYKDDGGVKVVLVTFERSSPKICGLLLEEPQDLKGATPGFYRLASYYQHFKGKLFYQIWLETPTRFFDQSFLEFKEVLKTLVVE